LYRFPGGVQDMPGCLVEQDRLAIEGNHRKEIGSTLNMGSAIFWHEVIVSTV